MSRYNTREGASINPAAFESCSSCIRVAKCTLMPKCPLCGMGRDYFTPHLNDFRACPVMGVASLLRVVAGANPRDTMEKSGKRRGQTVPAIGKLFEMLNVRHCTVKK
ncbi:MAG: hypothetical protein WCD00_16445 [Desulfuromonadaceae bacterium]